MDRNNTLKNIKKTVLLLSVLYLTSCLKEKKNKPAPYPFLSEINLKRKEVGLRIIDSSFSSYGEKSSSTFTTIGDFYRSKSLVPKMKIDENLNQAYFYKKFIELDSKTGKPISEADIYRSGYNQYGINIEDTIHEALVFRFYYEDYSRWNAKIMDSIKFKKGNWDYHYSSIDSFKFTSSNDKKLLNKIHWNLNEKRISKNQADSILKSWELKRLNY